MSDEPDKASESDGCGAALCLNLSRAVGLLLVAKYASLAFIHGPMPSALEIIRFPVPLLLPLAIIWFPTQISEHIGSTMGMRVARCLTPLLVALLGWLLFIVLGTLTS
jgi:hypothetical protein